MTLGTRSLKACLLGAIAAIGLLAGTAIAKEAAPAKGAKPPLVLATQGNFFVGGHYVQTKNDHQIMIGQMYVEYQIPAHRKHPYPIVMIHGGGQTGEGYYETPDGREGWATWFLRRGYAVYVVDQVDRGRSGYFTEAYGPTRAPNTKAMMQRFSVPQETMEYPQAKLHTQWPGTTGKVGDPVFDQFYAGNVEDMTDLTRLEAMNRAAGDALIDKIGPIILLVHSQSGPIGWTLANDRPDKIKALVAVESSGPPFYNVDEIGAPNWFKYSTKLARPWGPTQTNLSYDPPVNTPADLKPTLQAKADGPDLVQCYLQGAPVHKLPDMAKVPILMVGSAASYHVPYDHCTSEYLTQAGVKHDFIRLPSVGIHGNGHFMMIEKNSDQVAGFIEGWIERHAKK
ncbi:MAG TPA: alpha/beta hydrolase [Stellaceae bacterium]|nr:alpha/beta hydrolase [Stellaceae bacterium]